MSGEGTITIELCTPEAAAIVELIHAQLNRLAAAPKTQAVKRETVILGSLAVKLFTAVLPRALQEVIEEQDRLN